MDEYRDCHPDQFSTLALTRTRSPPKLHPDSPRACQKPLTPHVALMPSSQVGESQAIASREFRTNVDRAVLNQRPSAEYSLHSMQSRSRLVSEPRSNPPSLDR